MGKQTPYMQADDACSIIEQLQRRGFNLGTVNSSKYDLQTTQDPAFEWQQGKPVFIAKACFTQLSEHQQDIKQSNTLYQAILDGQEGDTLLDQAPYEERLNSDFESLGSSVNEGYDQEIETILFDAINEGNIVAEDLWIKISWLSFYEQDTSLRFRFSFGVDHVEDVAADTLRQYHSAALTDAVFPESRVITQNSTITTQLKAILGCDSLHFVERIIYFNAPNGGAYLHHDRERGHAGVVYAQLTGMTFWLALPKHQLINEITAFVQHSNANKRWPESLNESAQETLKQLTENQPTLSEELDSFANSTLINLINETEAFVQQLINNGHGKLLLAGDVILLPQQTDTHCCWHSVFNLGDKPGQALSFAVRT